MITLLFFGPLADRAPGRRWETPAAPTAEALVAARPELEFLKGDRTVRVAVNCRWAHWDTPLQAGDEVAFLPPMSGV